MTGKFSSILSVSQAYQIELNKDRYTKKEKLQLRLCMRTDNFLTIKGF